MVNFRKFKLEASQTLCPATEPVTLEHQWEYWVRQPFTKKITKDGELYQLSQWFPVKSQLIIRQTQRQTGAESFSCKNYGVRGARIKTAEFHEIQRIFDKIQFIIVSKKINVKSRFDNDLTLSQQRKMDKLSKEIRKLL